MGASTLSSRAIIGEFYNTLEQATGMEWINAMTMLFTSDQDSETYNWLGMSPAMREWVGGRHAKGFNENGITIVNKHYEATLEVALRELRRDKSGQILVRIQEMADRANAHWAGLLSTLIANGESTVCYDGQYYFDTDHSEGASGTQSNDISVDISALPIGADYHGSITAPSPQEMEHAILQSIQAMLAFKDDQGEPMNENAKSFLVMVPIPYIKSALAACKNLTLDGGAVNTLATQDIFKVTPVANARLGWTTKFATFRTDARTAPLIRQQETDVVLKAIAEGSELEFNEDKHHYGVDAWRNVGYGYWQQACLTTLT